MFAQVGLGKMQVIILGFKCELAIVKADSWIKNPFHKLKPGQDRDALQANVESIILPYNFWQS